MNLINAFTTSIKLFEAPKRRAKILIHVNFFILIKLFENQLPTIFSGTGKKLCRFILLRLQSRKYFHLRELLRKENNAF